MPAMRSNRLTLFERFLQLFAPVRPGEGHSVLLMLLQGFLLLLAYYLIRPVREALILAEGSPEVRSYAIGAVALTLIVLIPLYKRLYDHLDGRGNKSAVLRWVLTFFIVNLLAFCALGLSGVRIGVPFFIWVGVFSVMLLAQFWAFAADLFNVKTGQRLFAVIAVGSALGAWTGSQLSARLFALVGPYQLMLASAAVLACVVWISTRVERSVPEGSRPVYAESRPAAKPTGLHEIRGGFEVVLRNRYLLLIAVFVALINWVNSTGTYILAKFVSEHAAALVAAGDAASTQEAIARIYGDYYAWVTLLQLLLQMFVVSRVLRHFDVRGALLVLPVLMVASYGLIAVLPVFSLVRLMMVLENGANYSLHTTTCHSLFLPVTREEKYVGKTTIDTFFWRFGDLLHALMIFLVSNRLGLGVTAVLMANLGLALLALALAVAIGRQHRREVRENLNNVAPQAGTPLRDVYVPAGQMLVFSVPEDTFVDPDPGDTLSYFARSADGGALPAWLRFDRQQRTFMLCPPEGCDGTVAVELVATDIDGERVSLRFRVVHGADPQPRFMDRSEAFAHAAPVPAADAGSDKAPRT